MGYLNNATTKKYHFKKNVIEHIKKLDNIKKKKYICNAIVITKKNRMEKLRQKTRSEINQSYKKLKIMKPLITRFKNITEYIDENDIPVDIREIKREGHQFRILKHWKTKYVINGYLITDKLIKIKIYEQLKLEL